MMTFDLDKIQLFWISLVPCSWDFAGSITKADLLAQVPELFEEDELLSDNVHK